MQQRSVPSIDGFAGGGEAERGEAALSCSLRPERLYSAMLAGRHPVVRETLRPMLKSWLDEHLPSLVERMVQAEIERVARGR
jgi:hypothetical protein